MDALFDICGERIALKGCPNCPQESVKFVREFKFSRDEDLLECPDCEEPVYITDILRIHEQLAEFGDNKAAISRFMNVFEHLLVASLVNMLFKKDRGSLSRMAFILDGPLAIFGQPAKIAPRLMKFYEILRQEMLKSDLCPPVIMGVQKNGSVSDYARLINPYIRPNTFMAVSDAYRNKYIQNTKSQTEDFGYETYYGQDFIFKTEKGHSFVLGLPFPYYSKGCRSDFSQKKSRLQQYAGSLERALAIIRNFECDLYASSLVPVALAHRHASISLVPGGNVLNLLSRLGTGRNK